MARANKIKFLAALLLIYIFTIALPLVLHQEGLSHLVSNFYGESFELLELFGFSACLGLLAFAVIEVRLKHPATWKDRLPVWLTVFVGLFWLAILVETSVSPGDYPCYQNAAAQVLVRKNPYHGCFFYPPLMAQAMAALNHSLVFIGTLFGSNLDTRGAWSIVYYLFQSFQLILILLSYRLSLALSAELKLKKLPSMVLVTGLFILNIPLFRTVLLHQVNLWILASVLGILLLVNRYPFWAGLITAFSAHIKVYPLIFTLPFAVRKQWRALTGLSLGLVAFAYIPIVFGYRWTLWQQFYQFFLRFPQYNAPRNNSLYSIVANILVLAGADVTNEGSLWQYAPRLGYYLLVILVVAWLAWRFIQSRRMTKSALITDQQRLLMVEYYFLMDMVAAQLLISPSLWEHQWVIIIPFVIWVFSFQRNLAAKPHLNLAIASSLMVFAVPSFDVIPFSYVRIVGLLVLLWITRLVLAKPEPLIAGHKILSQSTEIQ